MIISFSDSLFSLIVLCSSYFIYFLFKQNNTKKDQSDLLKVVKNVLTKTESTLLDIVNAVRLKHLGHTGLFLIDEGSTVLDDLLDNGDVGLGELGVLVLHLIQDLLGLLEILFHKVGELGDDLIEFREMTISRLEAAVHVTGGASVFLDEIEQALNLTVALIIHRLAVDEQLLDETKAN